MVFLPVLLLGLSCAAAEPGLIIHLPFDRGFRDQGPGRFIPEINGDEVALLPGRSGKVLFVGGTEDWLDFPGARDTDLSGGATLDFWFKREDWNNPYKGGSGWQTLVHIDGMTVNINAFRWTLDADVSVAPASDRRVRLSGGVIEPDRWYHVALVYDAGAGAAALYLDGSRVDLKWGAAISSGEKVNPLRLGTWYKANQAFRGCIDEVRLYGYPRETLPPAKLEAEDARR